MSVFITGDTHGDQKRLFDSRLLGNCNFGEENYLIVCGDFGFIFYNDEREQLFLKEIEKLPFKVLFVDGNHENFPEIYKYPVKEWRGGRVHQIGNNLLHLMRGEIFEIEGKSFFALGGASSVDRGTKQEGFGWWPEELPSEGEVDYAFENLRAHGFKVDFIITHDMPRTMIDILGAYPFETGITGILDTVMYKTDFEHWYCGHWHFDRDITNKFTVLYEGIRKII